mgnify:CR=1 FL=1
MSTVEKIVVDPVYRIELSQEEAEGLFALLDDGVDNHALRELKLENLRGNLRTAGLRNSLPHSFNYLAETD